MTDRKKTKNAAVLSPEDMATLARWEGRFTTALRSGYCRAMLRREVDAINAVALKYGVGLVRVNYACSGCLLTLLRRVGRLYFASKTEAAGAEAVASSTGSGGTRRSSKISARSVRIRKL